MEYGDKRERFMRTILTILIMVCTMCCLCSSPAHAKVDTSNMSANLKKDLKEGVLAIKRLPTKYKDALLAEAAGLLWMDNGKNPYKNDMGSDYIMGEAIPFVGVEKAAKFVGTDGKIYNFAALAREKMDKTKIQKNWLMAKYYLYHVGKEAILDSFESNIQLMQEKYIIYWKKKMPVKFRDAFLAEAHGLFHVGKNEPGTTGTEGEDTIRGIKIKYMHAKPGAKYVSTDGKEYDFKAVSKERYDHQPVVQALWVNGKYFMHLIGKDKFMEAFKEEISMMRLLADEVMAGAGSAELPR